MESGTHILTILSQREIASLPNKRTLYSVEAVDENGRRVTETLRTFAQLPLNKAMEFDVEEYNHERHGLSYTIKKPHTNSEQRLSALEKKVDDLIDRVSTVEAELASVRASRGIG